ncbi:MAG TPA: hypothetical protein VGX49_05400 [Jatrophihabitans sp.]|jgi:hypothetical protein|nr:hypothetical protein [Jatrophihabitans sp.]
MTALEDRLRAALTAKSDAVTLDEGEHGPEVMPAEVIRLAPSIASRPQRSRGLVASVVAVAAMLLLAVGAVALHRAMAPGAPGTVSPASVRPRSAVPWDRVGSGWSLQIAEPGILDVPGGTAGWLYLIDPDGQPYRISQVPDRYGFDRLPSWGRTFNEDRVLLMQILDGGRSSLLEIDLRTGAQHEVSVPGSWATAEFVGTDDILLNNVNRMIKVDAATGAVQTSFAGSEFFGNLISADRTTGQVISGGPTDLAVRDLATGRVIRRLAAPDGYQACVPTTSWMPGNVRFVARCQQTAAPHAFLRFEFAFDGSTPPVRPAVPDGWDEIQQPDGIDRPTPEEIARIAMKNPDPSRSDIGAMSFARVSAAGRLEPLAVPEELRQSGWSLAAGTPDGFLVEHATADRDSVDAAATWNPLTGQVRYLFQKGGSKGSPRENLAAWRTSQL